MTRRKKNNIIIGALLGIVLLMAVGYAAFSSVLNIQGTGAITTSWNIQITNIETVLPSDVGGRVLDGYNISEPTYTPTSATFNAGFELPGSVIYYVVEVSNMGSLDAQVTIGNLNCGDNNAIICYANAMDENPLDGEPTNGFEFDYGNQDYSNIEFTLSPSDKHYILIGVGYDDVTEQPTDLDANVTLDLMYEQYSDGTSGETTTIGGQEVPIMVSRDGLYVDEYEAGRYVYKGADPDNYIEFDNGTWRIISKEADGTYKLMKSAQSDTMRYDGDSNEWATSEANEYLNGDYYNNLPDDLKRNIVPHIFYTGKVVANMTDLQAIIDDEKSDVWSGNIGLINVSDFIRSFVSDDAINNVWNYSTAVDNYNTSYISRSIYGNYAIAWTMNSLKNSTNQVIVIDRQAHIALVALRVNDCTEVDVYLTRVNMATATYLSSAVEFSGTGTKNDPYVITN